MCVAQMKIYRSFGKSFTTKFINFFVIFLVYFFLVFSVLFLMNIRLFFGFSVSMMACSMLNVFTSVSRIVFDLSCEKYLSKLFVFLILLDFIHTIFFFCCFCFLLLILNSTKSSTKYIFSLDKTTMNSQLIIHKILHSLLYTILTRHRQKLALSEDIFYVS